MSRKVWRDRLFITHRILGLILGLIVSIVGLTGSLLVFEGEIDSWIDSRRFGSVTPVGEVLPLNRIFETIQTTYPDWRIRTIDLPNDNRPLPIQMFSKDDLDEWHQVYVNPYTGKVMGDRSQAESYFSMVYAWHATLLAGEVGRIGVGIASGLLVVLAFTGVFLWSGWRKLAAGFKIKWNAHPKRLNFDLHKVAGITMATFLIFTAFTGFCWTFGDWINPVIYALTFSSSSEEVLAPQPELGQAIASFRLLLEQAQQVEPNLEIASLRFPESKTEPFVIFGKDQTVYLAPYTANVLKVESSAPEMSLGDRIVGSFDALHLGTFAGLPSRTLYMFVGLAPLILFITGFIMWWYRKRAKLKSGVG